jgi:hypothetical protein
MQKNTSMQAICKQYAGFDDITLYCMQYAKYAKKMHDMQNM